MSNIDKHLSNLVKIEIENIKPDFLYYFSDERIRSVIQCLIKNELNNYIIAKSSEFINNNNGFLEDTIESLFKSKDFIATLKNNLMIKLKRDSSNWD
jgi:hypothetical protein